MKPNFIELVQEYNNHSVLLDLDGMVKAVDLSYQKGREDGIEEVLEWISKMDYLSDNIQYIKDEWNNQNQK